jgi:hypothetical protein
MIWRGFTLVNEIPRLERFLFKSFNLNWLEKSERGKENEKHYREKGP